MDIEEVLPVAVEILNPVDYLRNEFVGVETNEEVTFGSSQIKAVLRASYSKIDD